jgi:hypothetical protein
MNVKMAIPTGVPGRSVLCSRRAWLAAALAVLCAAGCHGNGPTAPGPTDTFRLRATMSSTDGTATMVDAGVALDGQVVASSCGAVDSDGNCLTPAVSTYTFVGGGGIAPGMHTLLFFVDSQTTGRPVTYTVSPFAVLIYDQNGKLLKTVSLPAQTATLPLAVGMTYTFTF